MIPSKPKDFDARSREGDVFRALSKLSDDYYVFHSVSETVVSENQLFEREIDFVIANRKKGILCLEVKAGANIRYENRTWKYSSGIPMSHGGPYNQIATAKRALIDKIKTHNNDEVRELIRKCKVIHGVFFVDVSKASFLSFNGLPEDADERITLFAEDLINPARKINEIFSISFPWEKFSEDETKLSEEEFKLLLDSVLCPHFNLIPSPKVKDIIANEAMNQLLKEQYKILDFLDDQDVAVINGAAGTGKTMVAVEKARRHSVNGESVLFLCYNKMLCDNLVKTHKNNPDKYYSRYFKNVDFMTISKLAKKVTGNHTDFSGLNDWLYDCLGDFEKFGYKHIIVDEGQDFGLIDSEIDKVTAENNCSIIDNLMMIAQENGGTFYLFYDKYQMIQGSNNSDYKLPECIENSDCRLTLHHNCRNTNEIAKTSVTTLKDKKDKAIKPVTACSWEEPIKPSMWVIDSPDKTITLLNSVLDRYIEDDISDIVILTPGVEDYSAIAEYIEFNFESGFWEYVYKDLIIKFTTCKKFKGLEAQAIIVIDLNKDSFDGKNGMQFYVGTSRARNRLELICMLSEEDFFTVAKTVSPNSPNTSNTLRMKMIFSNAFGINLHDSSTEFATV